MCFSTQSAMFSHVTSLSSGISNTRELAEYSRREFYPMRELRLRYLLTTLVCISAEKSSVATVVRNFSFAKNGEVQYFNYL